jgi:hypothetical protein
VRLTAGAAGRGKIGARAKRGDLGATALPLTTPVEVQLIAEGGACWGATYSVPTTSNGNVFKARSD